MHFSLTESNPQYLTRLPGIHQPFLRHHRHWLRLPVFDCNGAAEVKQRPSPWMLLLYSSEQECSDLSLQLLLASLRVRLHREPSGHDLVPEFTILWRRCRPRYHDDRRQRRRRYLGGIVAQCDRCSFDHGRRWWGSVIVDVGRAGGA